MVYGRTFLLFGSKPREVGIRTSAHSFRYYFKIVITIVLVFSG